jgi:hypothetical protein
MPESEAQRLRRRADQEWELAGLARQDRDKADEARHTKAAQEYERQLKAWLQERKS